MFLTIFVVFCVSILPLVSLYYATLRLEDKNRPTKPSPFIEFPVLVSLCINCVVTSATGFVSIMWGMYHLLSKIGLSEGTIAIIGFVALVLTFAHAADHVSG